MHRRQWSGPWIAALLGACTAAPEVAPPDIATSAHGVLLDSAGRPLAGDEAGILALQDQLVAALAAASGETIEAPADLSVAERIVAVRRLTAEILAADPSLEVEYGPTAELLHTASLEFAAIGEGEDELPIPPMSLVSYVDQCRMNGVPIPPDWPSPLWQRMGELPTNVALLDISAKILVYKYQDPAVPGLCVTLPRTDASENIGTMGFICQSSVTGKACFWDNRYPSTGGLITGPLATTRIAIDGGMRNGDTLSENCTDCHRGENVFLFHPNTPLSGPVLDPISGGRSPVWYSPVSAQGWTNPPAFRPRGPSNTSCTNCHAIGNLSPTFCSVVIESAADLSMPPAPDVPVGWWSDAAQTTHPADLTEIADVCAGIAPPPCGNVDTDGDGIGDLCDTCPSNPAPSAIDTDGDGDGDACDNCPAVANANQANADGDAQGDACDPDDDNDGLTDTDEVARGTSPTDADTDDDGLGDLTEVQGGTNPLLSDTDADGVGDATDGCPVDYNPVGSDGRQPDTDGDGVQDACDNCPLDANGDQRDNEGDGQGDVCDPDDDDDGVLDTVDNCVFDGNAAQIDADGDGIGSVCDDCLINGHVIPADDGRVCTSFECVGRQCFYEYIVDLPDFLGCRDLQCLFGDPRPPTGCNGGSGGTIDCCPPGARCIGPDIRLTDVFGEPRLELWADAYDADPVGGFGRAAVMLGDWNDDRVADLAVGEPFFERRGRVVIVSGRDGALIDTLYGEREGDTFGLSLAVLDDGLTLAVGAPFTDDGGLDAGTVTLYDRNRERVGSLVGGTELGGFGTAIGELGDLDRDGLSELLVGAPGQEGVAGQVVVISRTGQILAEMFGEPDDRFGASLGVGGDCDRDGQTEWSAGLPGFGGDQGGVWGYEGASREGTWWADGTGGFGGSLAGFDTCGEIGWAAGSPGAERGGQVDLLDGYGVSLGSISRGGEGGGFGTTLGAAGDLNGDRVPDFGVGAPNERVSRRVVGRSRLFMSVPEAE